LSPKCRRPPLTPRKRIFTRDGQRPDCAFHAIVVELDAAVTEKASELRPAGQVVSDRLRKFGFSRDPRQLGFPSGLEFVNNRG
jgi:hypothetical protein